MFNKKLGVLVSVTLLFLVINLAFIAASLDIQKKEVSTMAILELNKPAIFNLHITNNGAPDNFTIYNLVGLEMVTEPSNSFLLSNRESKDIVVKVYPTLAAGLWSFEYKIEGAATGITNDKIAINIVNLKDAFGISIDPIAPDSTKTIIHVENRGGHSFTNVSLELNSLFFSQKSILDLGAFETRTIETSINQEKMKTLLADKYIVDGRLTVDGKTTSVSPILTFNEKEGIITTESNEGVLYRRYEIEKKNNGNTRTTTSVIIRKNLISSLFTSFSINPNKREMSGFGFSYLFNKELDPDESLDVVVKTNWWILIIIIVAIIVIWYLIDRYIREKLVVRKTVSYVRTKGGEFALKVNIAVRARDYVEKIRLIDRLPIMVKLFDRGMTPADRIDEKTKRIEWNIAGLSAGEERIFSYIIYSKIGIVGKFELPQSAAIYEYMGKMKETNSNTAFFINNAKSRGEE